MKDLNTLALTKSVAAGAAILWFWIMLISIFTGKFPDALFHYAFGLIECICASIGIYHEELPE